MTESTTSTKKRLLDAEQKTTNTKEELEGFVEEVESSRNVHPMDLMISYSAEVWLFQAGSFSVSTRPFWTELKIT